MKKILVVLSVIFILCFGTFDQALASEKYQIAWSHYTGWEPWEYAKTSGILDKWAKKYNIEIDLVLVNDYIESINLYTTGKFDGCTMTNMDAMSIPSAGGIDSTVIIIGDFSNGNDGIVMKNGNTVKDLKDRIINLVELSVSHYLLVRALDMNGMTEKDINLINTSDSDIISLFISDDNGAIVTWNPLLMEARNVKGANLIFDSSKIPGEIIDMLVVKTKTPDTLKKALTGAWYETMAIMSGHGKKSKASIEEMAQSAGGTEAEFRAQLKATSMFYNAKDAASFANGDGLKKTMEYVRTFTFKHGLYGEGAQSKDFVGIEFPDKSVIGDKSNIKLRFNSNFMQMAADGKL